MKKSVKILLSTLIMLSIFSAFNYSLAIGFASTIGTSEHTTGTSTITTTNLINYAADCYDSCGYTSTRRLIDPGYTLLLSNLNGAEVQLYATHGSIDSISFKNGVAIKTGNSMTVGSLEYIGLNTVTSGLTSNTILVTYIACNTGGENGEASTDSIAYQTVTSGANISIGFKDDISYTSAEPWAERYNSKLSQGKGVEDSARYATSFIYADSNIHSWNLVYNPNVCTTNMKIGNAYTTNELISIANQNVEDDVRNILNENANVKRKIEKLDKNSIETILENENNFLNDENYEIETKNVDIVSIRDNTRSKIEYITYRFKIGDFYTNAGYVAELKDDVLIGIYDNNIDIQKQINAVNNKNDFYVNISETEINNFKKDAKISILNKHSEEENLVNINEENNAVKYYYDIQQDKKYIEIEVKSEITKLNDNTKDVAIDKVRYEI